MISKTAARHAARPLVRLQACEPMSLEECAMLLGCSRERVRQIEAAALRKAALRLQERGYSLADLLPDTDGPASSA